MTRAWAILVQEEALPDAKCRATFTDTAASCLAGDLPLGSQAIPLTVTLGLEAGPATSEHVFFPNSALVRTASLRRPGTQR